MELGPGSESEPDVPSPEGGGTANLEVEASAEEDLDAPRDSNVERPHPYLGMLSTRSWTYGSVAKNTPPSALPTTYGRWDRK